MTPVVGWGPGPAPVSLSCRKGSSHQSGQNMMTGRMRDAPAHSLQL